MARKYEIYVSGNGHRFVANTKLGPIVALISEESGCQVTRCYAGADAEHLIHEVGLHTQAEVIELHARGVPGYGPANPVWLSTHCEHNDGIAYRIWIRGKKLPWWACGIDVDPAHRAAFIATARRHGWIVTVTYPGSVGEAQHLNFRRMPRFNIWKASPLKHGMRSGRVRAVTRILCHIKDADGKPYLTEAAWTMTPRVVAAVKHFQRTHHQRADGVVGLHTWRNLQANFRHWKRHHNHK